MNYVLLVDATKWLGILIWGALQKAFDIMGREYLPGFCSYVEHEYTNINNQIIRITA